MGLAAIALDTSHVASIAGFTPPEAPHHAASECLYFTSFQLSVDPHAMPSMTDAAYYSHSESEDEGDPSPPPSEVQTLAASSHLTESEDIPEGATGDSQQPSQGQCPHLVHFLIGCFASTWLLVNR